MKTSDYFRGRNVPTVHLFDGMETRHEGRNFEVTACRKVIDARSKKAGHRTMSHHELKRGNITCGDCLKAALAHRQAQELFKGCEYDRASDPWLDRMESIGDFDMTRDEMRRIAQNTATLRQFVEVYNSDTWWKDQ